MTADPYAARPDAAAALLRTVTAVSLTGLKTLVQHWAADTRTVDGYVRTEWITRCDRSGDVEFTPQTVRYTVGQLDACRADWAGMMSALRTVEERGEGWTVGDTGELPPPPYLLSCDQSAPRRANRRTGTPRHGRLTLETIASPSFHL